MRWEDVMGGCDGERQEGKMVRGEKDKGRDLPPVVEHETKQEIIEHCLNVRD